MLALRKANKKVVAPPLHNIKLVAQKMSFLVIFDLVWYYMVPNCTEMGATLNKRSDGSEL